MSERAAKGRAAEDRALAHLRRAGLRLRDRNVRSRWGEIDLVMDADGTIVFVEVRFRSRNDFGGAAASVDAAKRARLLRSASAYLARKGLGDAAVRFDVVAVGADDRLEWISAAFEAA